MGLKNLKKTIFCFAGLAFVVSMAGCGGVAIHPVSGTVTADGNSVTEGSIVLSGVDAGLNAGSGSVQSDGSFKIASTLGEGVAAGNYRVIYSAPAADEDEKGNVVKSSQFSNWGVPTNFRAEIISGENSLTIELEKLPPPDDEDA